MNEFDADNVVIVGPGLLGGSLGLALRRSGYAGRIVGVARSDETLAAATARGCIDRGTTDLADGVRGAGVVVLAAPVGAIPALMRELGACRMGEAVVTDVGSTKTEIVASAIHLPAPRRFVGSHPMAGKTQQGPEAAEATLFDGKPCIVTPVQETDRAAQALVESMWRCVGMTIQRMSPQEHDRQTATVSHLPHALAVLLTLVAAEQGGWEIASTGFETTTRLASSNPPMRLDIMRGNGRYLLDALGALERQIRRLRSALQDEQSEPLLRMLEQARRERDDWLASRSTPTSPRP